MNHFRESKAKEKSSSKALKDKNKFPKAILKHFEKQPNVLHLIENKKATLSRVAFVIKIVHLRYFSRTVSDNYVINLRFVSVFGCKFFFSFGYERIIKFFFYDVDSTTSKTSAHNATS